MRVDRSTGLSVMGPSVSGLAAHPRYRRSGPPGTQWSASGGLGLRAPPGPSGERLAPEEPVANPRGAHREVGVAAQALHQLLQDQDPRQDGVGALRLEAPHVVPQAAGNPLEPPSDRGEIGPLEAQAMAPPAVWPRGQVNGTAKAPPAPQPRH